MIRGLFAILPFLAYFLLSTAYTAHSAGGLISPDGHPDLVALALGSLVLLMRLGILFVLLPIYVGRGLRTLLRGA